MESGDKLPKKKFNQFQIKFVYWCQRVAISDYSFLDFFFFFGPKFLGELWTIMFF
jgi:hypothetical protein